jgi:hypothetical protein
MTMETSLFAHFQDEPITLTESLRPLQFLHWRFISSEKLGVDENRAAFFDDSGIFAAGARKMND